MSKLQQWLNSQGSTALWVVFWLYGVVLSNAVWRNADNVCDPIYGQIARFLTVAWSINAVLVSGFLFLGHLNAIAFPLLLPF